MLYNTGTAFREMTDGGRPPTALPAIMPVNETNANNNQESTDTELPEFVEHCRQLLTLRESNPGLFSHLVVALQDEPTNQILTTMVNKNSIRLMELSTLTTLTPGWAREETLALENAGVVSVHQGGNASLSFDLKPSTIERMECGLNRIEASQNHD